MTSYYFRDLNTQLGLLRQTHRVVEREHARLKALCTHPAPEVRALAFARMFLVWDLQKAESACIKRAKRFYLGASKYRPHQGKQECARRVRQGVTNG